MEKLSNNELSESGEGESDSNSSSESSSSMERSSSIRDASSDKNESNGIRKPPLHNEAIFYYHANSEEFKFVDLSEVDPPDVCSEPGENTEPGYYGYYVDHPPSDPVKLSDKDSKPATDELPKIEKLSIVKKVQPNSLDLYRPKLADYKENVNRIEGIEENEEVKEYQNNEEQKFDNNERLKNQKGKKIIEEEKNPIKQFNTRNDIINRPIIRRAMANNDLDNNILTTENNFPDYGSREETDYYEQNNYFNQSYSVSMFSSELNNDEGNMNINREQSLPKTETRDIDPIQLYTQVTKKTRGVEEDGKDYELDKFSFRLFLSDECDCEVISNSQRLKRLPNINTLCIYDVQEEGDCNVQDFLLNVAPRRLEEFGFRGNLINKLNASFYLKGLNAVLMSTTIDVRFGYCIRD